MAQDNGMDRTEKPTAKKLEDARKKGQVAQSREIPSAMILMTSLAVFYFGGQAMAQQLADLMRVSFRNLGGGWIQNAGSVHLMVGWLFNETLSILMPMMLALLVIGIIANVAQFGFNLKEDAADARFKKTESRSAASNVWYRSNRWWNWSNQFLKIGFVGLIAYLILRQDL
jgi:flagellar biosynthetic protein FlhB